jgi:signal transduction histidine kinase
LRTAADEVGISAVQKRNIEDAQLDIEELIAVFEKLLRIAEAEAGARRIDFQSVALASVVSEVIDFYEAVAEAQGARLVFEPAGEAIVMGDPQLLAGAIANLVDNALKYGGAGTTVMLVTETHRDHVRLTVKDNGRGIAVADLKQLGTRFFRLDRTISGHGLGVASVTAVVALHGGRIWFEHAAPGLVVCMEFPRHKP